ncbi:MAG: methyltransferase domain-containing protein [Candidatus Portnoybacteria bacterium]|nr:methyltransferase domain-containing protein [Candidatus Portnoybacteria bacterium]
MKIKVRKKSLITGNNNLERLYSIKKFPAFIGCTEKPRKEDIFADMEFDICKDTGLVQLRKLLPLELIYKKYHSEAIGDLWKEHNQEFSKIILSQDIKNVLELGGSNFRLANIILDEKEKINWTVIDPSIKSSDSRINTVNSFFDEGFKKDKNIPTVVHSHFLEHSYNPIKTLKNIYKILEPKGKHIFSVPNLYKWLQKKTPSTLNFEHTLFLTEYFIDNLLPSLGFKIVNKKYFKDHSIFYITEKEKSKEKIYLENKYKDHKTLFQKFINYHEEEVREINPKIKNFKGDIYLFGGHIFSQFLLSFGLDKEKIKGILDNSKLKQGKRLYGSSFAVSSPEILRDKKNIAVILKAGFYTEEISKQILEINKNAIIFS